MCFYVAPQSSDSTKRFAAVQTRKRLLARVRFFVRGQVAVEGERLVAYIA